MAVSSSPAGILGNQSKEVEQEGEVAAGDMTVATLALKMCLERL